VTLINTGNNTLNTALQQELEKQVDSSSTQILEVAIIVWRNL